MSKTQWFVECNPRDNESLARLLDERAAGIESKHVGVLDAMGKSHDVWEIPALFVNRLRNANQTGNHHFKFFTRSSPNAVLQSANFLEKKKPTAKLVKAAADLQAIRARRPERESNDR
jgi:desulfoferrodoxin (superoxide reductase-like protein)